MNPDHSDEQAYLDHLRAPHIGPPSIKVAAFIIGCMVLADVVLLLAIRAVWGG